MGDYIDPLKLIHPRHQLMAMIINMPDEALDEVEKTLSRIMDFYQDPKEKEVRGIQESRSAQTKTRKEHIAFYERMYSMKSSEFLEKWHNGTMEDSFETNHWAMLLDYE